MLRAKVVQYLEISEEITLSIPQLIFRLIRAMKR
jgi:hypothetical protein